MPFIVQCPYCNMRARVPDRAQGASGKCSRCANFFTLTPADDQKEAELVGASDGPANPSSSDLEPVGSSSASSAIAEAAAAFKIADEAAAADAGLDETDEDTDAAASELRPAPGALPPWVSVWGFAALMLGGLALLLAPVLAARWLIIALAGLGLVVGGVGIASTATKRRRRDVVWLAAGGLLSIAVLGTALIAPGMLNRYWVMDGAVPRADPNQLVGVAKQGRVLTPDDAVDAATEAIGQDGVLLRLLSVGIGPLEENGAQSFLLIHMRIGSSGQERGLTFTGFDNDKHRPALKDGSGKTYPFLEQRRRKVPAGGLVFLPDAARPVEIRPMQFLDYQLVFETPAELPFPVILELPASAWSRKGVGKFRIAGLFEPSLPESVKKKD